MFADSSGVWMLYSPWRSLAPLPDSRRGRWTSPGSGFTPAGPYLAAGGPPPSRRRPRCAGTLLVSPVGAAARPATALPSAWPLVAFITAPVKNPASLSSPSR